VFGGHVSAGCIVRTTAEILLVRLPGFHFSREVDPLTGFPELSIRPQG
jgi:predicted DNA-binding protein with PD1-like motif